MAIYPEKRLSTVANMLLACLCQEALLNPRPPKLCGFRTGTEGSPLGGTDMGADECCGGTAFVRVLRTYPSWGVPNAAVAAVRCAQPFAAELELSMWRCVAPGSMGSPPTQAQWDEVHQALMDDRLTLMAAACCFWGQRDKGSVMIGEWTIDNTSGGCVGSVLPIQVDLYGGN